MAIYRTKNTGVATGGNGSDYGANACGTIAECSTSADETRLLYSPETTSALTATWSKGTAATPNRYVAISGGGGLADLAKVIDVCEASWVKAAGGDLSTVTYSAGVVKNGTANKLTLTFGATPTTAKLQAYAVVSNLTLAAYRNICAWIVATVGTLPANSLVIKLCTGNDGATGVVATLNLSEAQAALSANNAITLDNGGALPNGVNSIAIYTGAVAPAASSVWKFDTFYATVAGFGLNSMPKKPFNYKGAAWLPNHAYALNATICPTFASATPLWYKQVNPAGGVSGATENFTDADGQSKPIWDKAYLPAMGNFAAQRVTDGTCIWECQGDDESYYMWTIKSLNVTGNRIEIDNQTGNVGNAGRGYYGTDEATSLAWLTPYLYPMAAATTTVMDSIGASGTDAVPRTIRGGYDTNDNIVGVTVISGRNGLGYGLQNAAKNSIKITGGIVYVRFGRGLDIGASNNSNWLMVRAIITTSTTSYGFLFGTSNNVLVLAQHCWVFNDGLNNGLCFVSTTLRQAYNNKSVGHLGVAVSAVAVLFGVAAEGMMSCCEAINSAGYGINTGKVTLINSKTTLNAVAAFASYQGGLARAKNLSVTESTVAQASAVNSGYGAGILIQNFNGTTGDNRAYYPSMGQATYTATTHVWTIAVNNVNASQLIPMRHEVGEIYCDTAGVPYVISLTVNPSNAALVAQLKILKNTIAGVQFDTYAQSAGSGVQVLSVTITPLETGWVKIYLDCYITNTTLTYTLTYDLDDLAATQNAVAMRIHGIGTELFGEERVGAELGADLLAWETARNTITPSHVENLFPYKALGANEIGALGSTSSQSSRSDSSYSHSSASGSFSSRSESSHSHSSDSMSNSISSDSFSNSLSSDSSGSSSSLSLDGDCIQAQITAKLKALLANVTIANGYHYDVKAVEQARKVLDINGRWPFILLCENEPQIEEDLIVRSIEYIVWFFSDQDDELVGDAVADHDSEIAFKNRNAIADITKAIHQDIYLGGLAENCEVEPGIHDLYVDGNTTLFGTWCFIRVTTSIDSTDPYKLR